MRRSLSALALLALCWSQVAALSCDIRPHPVGDAENPSRHHAPRTVQHQRTVSAPHTDHESAPHDRAHQGHSEGGADCRLLMACGITSVEPIATVGLAAPELEERGEQAQNATDQRSVVLAFEPPPPRSLV